MYTYLQKLIITPKFRSLNSTLPQAMTALSFNFVRYKTRALLPTVRYGPISRVSVHRKIRKTKRNRTLKWPKGSMNLLGNHSVRPLGVTPYASNETERVSHTQLPYVTRQHSKRKKNQLFEKSISAMHPRPPLAPGHFVSSWGSHLALSLVAAADTCSVHMTA